MVSKPIRIGRAVASALVCVLMCGIVAAECPEFLSLTDNPANDFTVRQTDDPFSVSQLCASTHARLTDLNSKILAMGLNCSRLGLMERASASGDAATSRFVLRT